MTLLNRWRRSSIPTKLGSDHLTGLAERGAMGAWDIGSFGNDAALDFVDTITGIGDIRRAFEALGAGPDDVDADAASAAVAAADLVAAMMERPAADMPRNMMDLIASFGVPDQALLAAARGAVHRVRKESELAELWAEAGDQDWQSEMDALLARLDPSQPYTPPPPAGDEPLGEVDCICLLCDGGIPAADAVTLVLEDNDDIVASSFTCYAHRECLEQRFKPPHFQENDTAHPDLLAQVDAFLKTR